MGYNHYRAELTPGAHRLRSHTLPGLRLLLLDGCAEAYHWEPQQVVHQCEELPILSRSLQ